MIEELYGWGRWPKRACETKPLDATPPAARGLNGSGLIVRGLGRSYGDIAMNPGLTLKGAGRNRILSFDEESGLLVAQSGLCTADLIDVFLERGWFPPVTPGTKFATLAGLVAVDAHGKNHHKDGSFGDHVAWFDLLCADGETRRCARDENTALFNATIGGNGLTGEILTVAVKLLPVQSAWINQRTLPAANLDAAIELFEGNLEATYSVAWIDCLATGAARGRSLVLVGEHALPSDLPGGQAKPFDYPRRATKRMPMDAPAWALNTYSIRAFNHVYYRAGLRAPEFQTVDYDRYFYPLDAIHEWNRLYGRRGFAQYQCALPLETSRDGMLELLEKISASGMGSFLAVLKRFGKGAPERLLSFPMEGYTLALDFPLSPASLTLMDELDEITCAHGGRLYLAKDSRMSQATFEAGYGDAVDAFRTLRAETGARDVFHSLMSKRLSL